MTYGIYFIFPSKIRFNSPITLIKFGQANKHTDKEQSSINIIYNLSHLSIVSNNINRFEIE